MKQYVADFETTTTKENTRIWAFGHCEIGNVENFSYGTTMDEFMDWCKQENKILYFHNLKFDGEFIIHWLLTNGFTYSKNKESKTFNCIISNMGAFYKIEIIFEKKKKKYKKVEILDSHKKLPFPLDKVAKGFKLPIQKIEVEGDFYTRERPLGHELTSDEIAYLKNDVQVIAMALGIQFEQDLRRMTVGSDSLHNYKKVLGKGDKKAGDKEFLRLFPTLPLNVDNEIRDAYRGGYTYLQEIYGGVSLSKGIVYDVNSLYPSVMYDKPLPYGMPLAFLGKYKEDDLFPLYIQRLLCEFELKEGYLPTVQLKHGGRFKATEYLKSSRDKMGDNVVTLVMTNVDLELFFEHYDVIVHEYQGGWKFKQAEGLFCEYIDHWTKIKIENSKEKNALYTLAKLMLNSLYGKFATNPDVTGKYPVLNKDGSISYKLDSPDLSKPVYTAMGAFITSYARDKTIRTAQTVYDRFVYADTDSIHLKGEQVPEGIDIHENRMGAWACEGVFEQARFLRAKTYVEVFDGKLHVTCAGMPDNVKQMVTWENFHKGLELGGKLQPLHVPGGIVLEPTTFTIT